MAKFADQPAHDLETERRALGLILLGEPPQALERDDLHFEQSRTILAAIHELAKAAREITTSTLFEHLDSSGKLAEVGGPQVLASLLEAATARGHLEGEVLRLRRLARIRRAIALSRIITDAPQGSDPVALIERLYLESEAARMNGGGPDHWLEASTSSDWHCMETAEIGAPVDLFRLEAGGAWLPQGGLALIHGATGLGKSWLSAELALAAASGTSPPGESPLSGLTVSTQSRTLLLTLELDEHPLRERLRALIETRRYQVPPATLYPIWLSRLPHPIDLSEPRHLVEIERVIRDRQCQLVIIDTLARTMSTPETQEFMRPIMLALEHIARKHLCGIVIAHHDRKLSQEKGATSEGIHSARGSGDLTAFAKGAIQVVAVSGPEKTRKIIYTKANLGAQGRDAFYRHAENGLPLACDAPADQARTRGKRTRQLVLDALRVITVGTTDDVRRAMGDDQVSRDTAIRHLEALVASKLADKGAHVRVGKTSSWSWSIRLDDRPTLASSDTHDTHDTH